MRAMQIIAENKIKEAMEKGEFDNLPGCGQRLDLEEYFTIPEEQRMAYTLLKNAAMASQEAALLRAEERLREQLEVAPPPELKGRLESTLGRVREALKRLA